MAQQNEAWREYAADFDGMTDAEIERETLNFHDQIAEADAWLEAVASWEAAGRPRSLAA